MTPPEEDYTVILPDGITDEDLDTVNLTVRVVARKGKSFLVELTRGEINNYPQSYSKNLIHITLGVILLFKM
ncbi:BnaC03g27630D [Brassica napus]|uniref:BnaC03g27630D protein n=2 Tax=Brassica TaxID=3705 RepID=A0A078G7P2_BRANA|nr:BnaC03g27630D [Brassica napus]